jgi:hypothetical protein
MATIYKMGHGKVISFLVFSGYEKILRVFIGYCGVICHMAKKKAVKKKKPARPKKYEKSTLAIVGTLDEVLKVSVPKPPKK